MRLTVNLDPELYAVAKSLARAEDCSISAAVNRLIHRALSGSSKPDSRLARQRSSRSGFRVSRGIRPITAETVHEAEAEDDQA